MLVHSQHLYKVQSFAFKKIWMLVPQLLSPVVRAPDTASYNTCYCQHSQQGASGVTHLLHNPMYSATSQVA